jgi:hypothetical protein
LAFYTFWQTRPGNDGLHERSLKIFGGHFWTVLPTRLFDDNRAALGALADDLEKRAAPALSEEPISSRMSKEGSTYILVQPASDAHDTWDFSRSRV